MPILLTSTSHDYHHDHHDSLNPQHKAMTISYPDHSNLSYGLITPPSEMRSTNIDNGTDNAAVADPNNILAPPTTSRYNLRKQHPPQPPTYSVASDSYPNNNYNSFLQVRRRSGSSSTTATSSTLTTILPPVSPPLNLESRNFNVGDFTATVLPLIID
jgi:hypothetical protein